jgi:virulence-associated protein VapD
MSIQDRSITFVTEESVMTTQLLRRPSGLPSAEEFDAITSKEGRVYAIAFDMDIESLKNNYGDPYNNAYYEIRRVLQKHGFTWQQGSVYFGGEQINAVTCVLAAMDLARSLPWFAASVRDIRMLRIEELNDLMPAVQQAQP